MARGKKMQFYLSDQEYILLQEYAEDRQISMAEVLRDYQDLRNWHIAIAN
ncbi:MAG: hypothetical protein KME31_30820 [Tolypothrix carrinoi HA7290-LM1]|jgi:hypothetical protein|nr:hypothetical protein [Tolypothrix carrinoi HA7290-LM1]